MSINDSFTTEMRRNARLIDIFGPKPLFIGVYTSSTAEQMLEEVKILADNGVEAVYLENVNKTYFGDCDVDRTPEDLHKIGSVIRKAHDMKIPIKMGVNIMPNGYGSEYITAFDAAHDLRLDFIICDAVVGKYSLKGIDRILETDAKGFLRQRRKNPVFTIGGYSPTYGKNMDTRSQETLLRRLSYMSDAMTVKNKPSEGQVPLERLEEYRSCVSKPLILASKTTTSNISLYAPIADAFIIGSGARNADKTLSVSSIYAMNTALYIDRMHCLNR
jgi:predicted TIM-barrel enzyme